MIFKYSLSDLKVISGGQTGADEAGLAAAYDLGIKVGGTAPNGYRTSNGSNPLLGTKYGLEEHSSSAYPPRTKENAKNSDATIRIARDFSTAGEKLTLSLIKQFKKPHYDILVTDRDSDEDLQEKILGAVKFLKVNKVLTLNVAGNSNARFSTMFDDAYRIIYSILAIYIDDFES